MGSILEFNDTLKLESDYLPEKIEEGKEYTFNVSGRRIFHMFPVRIFLVEEKDEKWNYIGHAQIIIQTINALDNTTSGKYIISKKYSKDYMELVNRNEPPKGKEVA
jgi:hypothetical protein